LRLRPRAPEGDREGRKTDERFHWHFSIAKVSVSWSQLNSYIMEFL
jgi:hypothetical protein